MMTSDSRGYSYSFVKEVQAANPEHIGVRLGLHCIEHNLSVGAVAEKFGVSRHTIYAWFRGKFSPRAKQVTKIEEMLGVASSDTPAV